MPEETPQSETILAVRIPADQREKIKTAAKIEERTESAFVRFHIIPLAEDVIAQSETTNTVAYQ